MRAILLADETHVNYHAEDFFRVYSDYVLERLQAMVSLDPEPVFLSQFEAKKEQLQDVELIFSNWGMPEISEEQVREYLPQVKAVIYAGGDVQDFAAPFYQQGARIFCTGHANAIPASEYAFAQILLATKGVQRAGRIYRDPAGYELARAQVNARNGNYRSNVGILGLGRAGSRVARLLQSFDMTVYGCDPFLSPQRFRELGVTLVSQEDLFQQCDVVTCHLPGWSSLRGCVGYREISSMHDNATFINISHAIVVDQEGLIQALRECPTKTAILDYTDPMPLPKDHPLLNMPNIFVTPHIAGSFGGELERMGSNTVEACEDLLAGRPSPHEVFREQTQAFHSPVVTGGRMT